MPTYRVEVSPNNRAGCQDSLCKKEGIKIMKGEIRFGTWVEGSAGDGREFQSWKWRHWGCVSGKTIQNIRDTLTRDGDKGVYAWDYMDGLEDMPEDLQKKFKNAITEGKIADEDWKGDPDYNVLGKTGIRGRASAKKKAAEDEEDKEDAEVAEAPTKSPSKKRGRAKKDEADENGEDGTPIRKKRATKFEKDDESENETKPTKKARAKKATKTEEVDGADLLKKKVEDKTDVNLKEHNKPINKKAAKKEGDSKIIKAEAEADVRLVKTQTGGRVPTKKAEDAKPNIGEGSTSLQTNEKPTKKSRAKKGAKNEEDIDMAVKAENADTAEIDTKPAKSSYIKKAIKKEDPTENITMKRNQQGNKLDVKPTRKARAKIPVQKEEVGEDDLIKSEKPDNPLEQIAQGFCNEKGPLYTEFNQVVAAGKFDDDDWGGFLENKFGNMIRAGEFAQGDYHKFLEQMHAREVMALQSQADFPKKKGKAKKPAAAVRGRKAQAA